MDPLELAFTVACLPVRGRLRAVGRPDVHVVAERALGAEGDGTAVKIVHSGWERLGAVAEERRERNEKGWACVLEHYRAACGTS